LRRRIPEEELSRLDGRSIEDVAGKISRNTVVQGLYSSGRPSLYLKSYFDIDFNYRPAFQKDDGGFKAIDISDGNRDLQVFNMLSELVDPGGKIIVAVTSPLNLKLIDETFTALNYGIPPEATYIGSLLYRCGCGSSFKIWLIREGGREGPPALQGEKAVSEDYFKAGLRESVVRLIEFLKSPTRLEILSIEEATRSRALSILKEIRVDDRKLQEIMDSAVRPASI